jgi:hypothetical protein
VPYLDVARWVSASRPTGAAATSRAGLLALQAREDLKYGFLYRFTFSNVSNVNILVTTLPSSFQSYICKYFNFVSRNFEININKNSVKYLRGISSSQLTLGERAEIKNLGRATRDLFIYPLIVKRNKTYVRKFNIFIQAKHKLFSCYAKKHLLTL